MVVLVAAIAGLAGWAAPGHLSEKESELHGPSESFDTQRELETVAPKSWPGLPDLAVITRGNPDTAGEETKRRLESLPEVGHVFDHVFDSRERRSSAVLAWLRKDLPEGPTASRVADKLDQPGVMVGGLALTAQQVKDQVKEDLLRAEMIAFPLLILLGLWVFRSAIAALLPVVVGGLGMLLGLGAIRALNEVVPMSLFSLNLAVGVALGLGVDYSLLMVSRFREELATGRSSREACQVTVRTAGKTVALSSSAIAVCSAAGLVFPIPVVRSMTVAGMMVALIAGLTALAVLPAIFALLGEKINAFAPRSWQRKVDRAARPLHQGPWYRIARFVMRRPVTVAVASAALLISLGIPSLGMRLTGLDISILPASAQARVFVERARDEFDNPGVGEIAVAIHGDGETARNVAGRINRLALRSGLGIPFVQVIEHSPHLWQVDVNPTHPIFSAESQELVERLRRMRAPIGVAGETANYIDSVAILNHYLPYALLILAVVAFVFVFLATGSLVLPIKALIMNVLSLGAAFGVLVLIFQDGRLQDLLGYRSQGALMLALPVVLAAGAFGLLTDYGLFLLMRIKEAREAGLPDREAIALGLERTGRIVTAAALLFCGAVGAFATSELILIKEGAIGLGVAVALDAFVIRPLLVPSLMAILGRWNWWPRRMAT
ncbi:MAG TPA: MMPL family transporter [Solirubrobacterales bacterium]|nr:MMPL family transporter [Solirubrobacterales bacterium]